jgi:glycine dehydrogenase subunit 2
MFEEKTGLIADTPVIFELSSKGRRAVLPPQKTVPDPRNKLPERHLRKKKIAFPELSQSQVVRHFTNLSRRNFSVDTCFYPLGSCTMKYNPKINEDMAALQGFSHLHPFQDENHSQGMLQICYELEQSLSKLTGLPGVSLQPAAGAHGELASMLIIRAYFNTRGETGRRTILIPDTAHGTNPASAHHTGFSPLQIPSGSDGNIDMDALKAALNEQVAGIMITNPNTLGLFEKRIEEICGLVHKAGALVYMDGANFNAIMGIVRPGDFGADIMHLNLHKTFSTPHGGGGPGSGPIAVTKALEPFLPIPVIIKKQDGTYALDDDRPESIGRMRGFYGNLSVVVRAYTYIQAMGYSGLRRAAEDAVLNANYLRHKLSKTFSIPYDDHCMHEFVLSLKDQKKLGVKALDFAKALIDYSIHPPTVYFPLIVPEAMMIEPTETETPETLDKFVMVLEELNRKAASNPEELLQAPRTTPVTRLDELTAARQPVLSWPLEEE